MAADASREQGSKKAWKGLGTGLAWALALFAVLAPARSMARSGGDSPFGTVGRTPEFRWHRFYNADWTWLQTPADPHRLYTLAKLDHRREADLQWCREAAPWLCLLRDRKAQRRFYDRIFEREKDGMARIVANHNALHSGNPPPLYLTIGNEPNAYPYVDPEVYAEAYWKYRTFIQGLAPGALGCGNCRVLSGGILLFDLRPASPLPLGGMGRLAGRLARAAGAFPGDREVTLAGYLDWTRRFLARLHDLGGSVDLFDVHVYQGDLRLPLVSWSSDPAALERFIAAIQSIRGRDGSVLYPDPRLWIGEFGSLQPAQDEVALIAGMEALVRRFEANPRVERWFWFKHAGKDSRIPWAPPVGLYRDPADPSTRTPLGKAYLALQGQRSKG